MKAKYDELLSFLLATWQAGRLYSPEHPQFIDFLEKLYPCLSEILRERPKLTLAIIGEDILIGEEIRIECSPRLKLFFQGLRERGLEKLTFFAGLEKEELAKLMAFISLPQKRTKEDLLNFLQLENIKHITVGKIEAALSEAEKSELAFPHHYQGLIQLLTQMTIPLKQQKAISPLELKYLALSILENFSGNYWEVLRNWPSLLPEERLWGHLFNTALLVMTAASRLGFSKDDWLDLGVAALCHDLGKTIAFSSFPWSREDHTIIGAKLLSQYRENLSSLPAIVALEHHLRYDLKGQPKLPGISEPHEASLIVSIANVYEHLLRKMAYDNRFTPKYIYELMLAEKGRAFSPEWLEAFFQVMGVWPEGWQVILSDGRKGRVIRQNKNEPERPRIEIILSPEETQIVDLATERNISIVDSLNPFAPERENH